MAIVSVVTTTGCNPAAWEHGSTPAPVTAGELNVDAECARLMRVIDTGKRKVQAEVEEAIYYLQLLKINGVLEERKTAGEDLLDAQASQTTRNMRTLEPELIQDVELALEFVRKEYGKCKLDEADRAGLASKYRRSPMEDVLETFCKWLHSVC